MLKLLLDKLKESSSSVIPIIILVLILSFTAAPMPTWNIIFFLFSAVLMIVGIALFNLGVDTSLIPIGEYVGSSVVKSRKLAFIIIMTFVIGVFVTVAEPDLILLAGQINGVPDSVIIFTVAAGVGLGLVGAFLRILFQWPLSTIMIGCYLFAFVLSSFTNSNFLSIAWESGAVTTGPIMVPFVMALGLGLASIRGDNATHEDSFGLVALTLICPILAVLILGMFFSPTGGSTLVVSDVASLGDIAALYKSGIEDQFSQVALALAPMLVLFVIFQIAVLRLKARALLKIGVGTIYTYIGMVLFLASANVGFMPAGYLLGSSLIANSSRWVLVLVGFVTGFFVVAAEPAVFVLKRQVEDATAGAIPAKAMGIGLSVGVGIAVALSMLRVLTGISLLYIIVPGYLLALILTFVVPRLFTSIAFDSGAVASGPLAATFMLPLAIGASEALGGNIFTDAFGIVAVVALFPVLILQLFGVAFVVKSRKTARELEVPAEDTIIDLDYSANASELSE
ncbi:MAG: DUF1538 domain-containing protein [Candidatus Wallacebacter cryptica]|nr:DUF1538 domain-containing protein [Bacillota bacterium]